MRIIHSTLLKQYIDLDHIQFISEPQLNLYGACVMFSIHFMFRETPTWYESSYGDPKYWKAEVKEYGPFFSNVTYSVLCKNLKGEEYWIAQNDTVISFATLNKEALIMIDHKHKIEDLVKEWKGPLLPPLPGGCNLSL